MTLLRQDKITNGLITSLIESHWSSTKCGENYKLTNKNLNDLLIQLLKYEKEELFEEIPEYINVPFDSQKPVNEMDMNDCITFFKSKGLIIYDGMHAAASSFNYVYRNKGTRIILFENGDITTYCIYSYLDESGFNLSYEEIDNFNVKNLNEVYFEHGTPFQEFPIETIHFWLNSLANINEKYSKSYYLEYLMNPPDVNGLSEFSKEFRQVIWEIIVEYIEKLIFEKTEDINAKFLNFLLNLMATVKIEIDPTSILKLLKFTLSTNTKTTQKQATDILEQIIFISISEKDRHLIKKS